MPLYEYSCKDCGQEFEKMVRFSEADAHPVCPTCGGLQTRKKLSTIATMGMTAFGSGSSSSSSGSCGSRGGFS